jgi:hypothetical protein
MPEFIDTLGTPGDYQRPVGSGKTSVDIFSPIADLAKMFVGGGNSGGSGSELSDIKAIRDIRADKARDEAAIYTTAAMTGNTSNLEILLGEGGKDYLDKIRKYDALRKSGELEVGAYDTYMENVVNDLQYKYPDAADEVGAWFAANNFDHMIGREYKAREAALKAQTEAENSFDAEMYKLGMANITSMNLTPETVANFSYQDAVARGIFIANQASISKMSDEALARSQAESAAAAAKTEAERAAAKFRNEKAEKDVVRNFVSEADPVLQLMMQDISFAARTLTATGNDTGMAKKFSDGVQVWRQKIDLWEAETMAQARAKGVSEEAMKPVADQAAKVRTFITEWTTKDPSAIGTQARHLDMLTQSYKLEGTVAMGAYQTLKAGLGDTIINGLFDGTLPNFGKADISALRDQMVGWANSENADIRNAVTQMNDFTRALNSPDIPVDLNPEQLKTKVLASAVGLSSSMSAINLGKGTPETASHYVNGSKSLMKVVGDGLGPTMTPEGMEKAVGTLFNPGWRSAWRLSTKFGVTPQDQKNLGNLSSILSGEALDTLKNSDGVTSGRVLYDKFTKRYKAPENPGFATGGGATGSEFFYQSPSPATQIDQKTADQMNLILEHLEVMNQELGFVPKESLKGPEGGEPLTVRDIFANDKDLVKSMSNWAAANQESGAVLTSKSEFNKLFDSLDTRYDFSGISQAGGLEAIANSGDIRARVAGSPVLMNSVKDMNGYRTFVGQLESGGNRSIGLHSDDPDVTAAGTYGFQLGKGNKIGTWDENLIAVLPSAANLTKAERAKMMEDPVIEDAVMDYFTAKNFEALTKSRGKPPSFQELNMAHFLGAKGATEFMNAFEKNPNGKVSSLLSAEVIEKNPKLKGQTLLQAFNERNKRGDASFQQYMEEQGIRADTPSANYFSEYNEEE